MDEVVKSGAYDRECEKLMHQLEANMVLLMVVGGSKGHGMSVCINSDGPQAQDQAKKIPDLLRQLADLIQKTREFKQSPNTQEDKSWSDISREKTGED